MKKIIFLFIFCLSVCEILAQELQFHYDFTDDRDFPTFKFRLNRADNMGYTYINAEYDIPKGEEMTRAYLDVTRNLQLGYSPWSIRAEYNGGLYHSEGAIHNAWVAGLSYALGDEDVHFEIFGAYRRIINSQDPDNIHFGAVSWFDMLNGTFSFFGFIDFWTENKDGSGRSFIMHAEPQIWANITESFSLGSEFEFSNNLYGDRSCIYPTIAARWIF